LDPEAINDVEWIKGVVAGLRNIRGEMNISPAKPIPVLLKNTSAADRKRLEQNHQFLIKLAKLDSIELLPLDQKPPMSAIQLVDDMELLVPMQDLIDVTAELARLNKEASKLDAELARISGKLKNSNFIDKAPQTVVEKEQAKLAEQQLARDKIGTQIAELKTLKS
ncbi:MAG: valine--tRNA ligase, partial [Pseudomonadales bacterium]|nr:valine--tRNA ligase [Pseudomonadales bacterium]